MRRSFLATFSAWALLSSTTQAGNILPTGLIQDLNVQMLGTDVNSGGPDSICSISLIDAKGSRQLCTGTLTTENEVLTAAHCFDSISPGAKYQAHCGFVGVRNKLPKFKDSIDIAIVESHAAYSRKTRENDIARVTLKRPARIKPMRVVPDDKQDEFFVRSYLPWKTPTLKEGVECQVGGFGFSAKGDGALNIATIAPVTISIVDGEIKAIDKVDLTKAKNAFECEKLKELDGFVQTAEAIEIAKTMHDSGLFKNISMPGDSGGPLYCRHSPTDQWSLIGVISGMQTKRGPGRLGELEMVRSWIRPQENAWHRVR